MVMFACAGSVLAQLSPFVELRRWRSPDVVCAACDAAGTIAALGMRDASGESWEVLLYDPRARRELRRLPLAKKPIAVRVRDSDHVEVRVRDRDTFLSLSHWHRLRVTDGVEVGEPALDRLEDDDPAARARMSGEWKPGPGPCVFRDAEGSVRWWRDGASNVITDGRIRAMELSADGRFVILWLPSRLLAVPVAGGEATRLPVASEDVHAIEAGSEGDEVLVVTTQAVHVFRAGTGRVVRTVPHAVRGVYSYSVALAPGGGLLAIAAGGSTPDVLLDLDSGRTIELLGAGYALAWSPDGQRLARGTNTKFYSLTRDGRLMSEGDVPERMNVGSVDISGALERRYGANANVLALDGDIDAWCFFDGSVAVVHDAAMARNTPSAVLLRLWERLGPSELIATQQTRLVRCDAASWRPTGEVDLQIPVSSAVVARAVRRVAAIAGPEVIVFEVRAMAK